MNNQQNLTEFEVISRYFSGITSASLSSNLSIDLSVGDDCALLSIPEGQRLALSVDTLVAGRHFPITANPNDIAQRAVAVAISDLAAMGAQPLAFTLALTLPTVDNQWLEGFSSGLRQAAAYYQIPLIGGDTTCGPLTITLQVHGLVPVDGGLLRSGAQVGDTIFVTGCLGDAAAALALIEPQPEQPLHLNTEQQQYLYSRFYTPQIRVDFGQRILTLAHAAIDISDGLLADLGHICTASGVGAIINIEDIPLSTVLATAMTRASAVNYALTGGDDYELCFTAAANQQAKLMGYAKEGDLPITAIGRIVEGDNGIICIGENNHQCEFEVTGYQHF